MTILKDHFKEGVLRTLSEESPYIRIGGEARLKQLVEHVFELLENLPEVWELRQTFDGDLGTSQKITYNILRSSFGAPIQESPNNDCINLPLPRSERQLAQWHLCLQQALNDLEIVEDLQIKVIDTLSCCQLPRTAQVA